MAQTAGDKTEQATPERIRKAREEGQVPYSAEVPTALVMMALLLSLALGAPTLYHQLSRATTEGLDFQADGLGYTIDLVSVLHAKGLHTLMMLAPFLAAMGVAGVLGSVVVSGLTFSPKAIRIRLDRLSPGQGFKNLISSRAVVTLLISLAKLGFIGALVWSYLHDKLDTCLGLGSLAPQTALLAMGELALGILLRVTVAMMFLAGADWLFQRWKFLRDLRMTRQEVKDERRQQELAPEVRSRIRQVQAQLLRKRMLKKVKDADMVLVNPTHVAVALKYDPATMACPMVVAKGADFLCQKIKDIAREHNVPIVERPELARMLYKTVEVDQAIPETLFVAVAEVLAMIFRTRKKKMRANR